MWLSNSINGFFASIKRNPLRFMGSVFLLSTLFFVLFLLLMFVSFTIQSVDMAQKKVNITFFVEQDAPEYKIALLKASLMKMQREGQIMGFQYFTAEEVSTSFSQSNPERYEFLSLQLQSDAPISPMFTINPGSQNVSALISYFLTSDFSETIDSQKLSESSSAIVQSKRMLEFLGFIRSGILGILAIIFVAISIITTSFIASSFHFRKNEIFIMRLVGATSGFIRTPFMVESVLMAIIAAGIGWAVFFLLRYTALSELFLVFTSRTEALEMAQNINAMWSEFIGYLPITFGVIVLFTIISSFFTMEYLLRKKDVLSGG